MKKSIPFLTILTLIATIGCAHIDYGQEGLTYYDPQPYLFVTTTKDCVSTATVIAVPGAKRSLKLKTGYGSAELNATFNSGMLASIGQKTDTKIPETITSIAALGTAIGGLAIKGDVPKEVNCIPTAILYPIDPAQGPNSKQPIKFPVELKK